MHLSDLSPLHLASQLLLAYERRVRDELKQQLAETNPRYDELVSHSGDTIPMDDVFEQFDLFAEAYPEFDKKWYRRLRWKLEAADRRIYSTWRTLKRKLGWRSQSLVWHVMHTSPDEGELHWQCPDCDWDGLCHDDDPDHICTGQIIFDVSEVDTEYQPVICSFCGRIAPRNTTTDDPDDSEVA